VPPLLKLTLVALAIVGGFVDLRTRRIPNWLNLCGIILGIGLNTLFLQSEGFKTALGGAGIALLIYMPLYLIRAMGAGDVKFMAAIGSIVGPQNWLGLFLVTAILGGVASLFLIAARGRFYLTMANVSTITGELLHCRLPFHKDPSLDVHDKRAVGLPHGTLIGISTGIFLAFLYKQP
jgi:prepilin peptidase CpaA